MEDIARPTPTNIQGLLINYMSLEARLSKAEDQLQRSLSQPALSQPAKASAKEPKIADPEPFEGDRLQLTNFLSQCQLKIYAQSARYPDEITKIHFAGSFLRGGAYSWFQPLLASSHKGVQPAEFESFKTFTDALSRVYGDPNPEITAERELRQLRQSSSATQYIAEFQRLRQYVRYNEAALISQFYHGLRDNIKDRLADSPRPKTLAELMKAATSHDSRISERILERKANNNAPPPPPRTPSPSSPRPKAPYSYAVMSTVPDHPCLTPSPKHHPSPRLTSLESRSWSMPPHQPALSPFASPNRFSALSNSEPLVPEYAPLIEVEAEILSGSKWVKTHCLIDSGAQGSLVDKTFSETRKLPAVSKMAPMSLTLADGGESQRGQVTEFSPVTLKIGDHVETLALDKATLGYPIILGLSWIKKHDCHVKFAEHRLSFDSPYCKQHCLHGSASTYAPIHHPRRDPLVTPCYRIPSVPPPSIPPPSIPPPSAHLVPITRLGEERIVQRDGSRKVLPPRNPSDVSRPQVQRKTPSRDPVDQEIARAKHTLQTSRIKVPSVSLVGAEAFAVLLRQGHQVYTMQMEQVSKINAMSTSTSDSQSTPSSDPGLDLIPLEYKEFHNVFSKETARQLPEHRVYDHRIPLQEGAVPPFGPVYSLSPHELDVLREYIDDNLKKGYIRHSQSPCGAPILFVKKADGSLRLCVDYRGLNNITTKNRYLLPLIGELLNRLGKAKYFTKFDMRDGYHLLRMALGEEWKTAFCCRYGLFEYQVMPFGLCNAPGTFQHFVNDTFSDYLDDFLAAYLDDLLVYSNTLKEHKRHVRLVLKRLQAAGLHIKPQKCQFHVTEVSFLGFLISEKGIRMDPAKVAAITTWPVPRSVHDIQVFLGFANFYRRFIDKYSRIASAITALLKKGVPFLWTPKAQAAFENLKKAFTTAPILRHFDQSRPAIIETDASDYAEGGVLSQLGDDGELHPCAFFSRKFKDAEINYEIYDKEMMAIVDCMETWRHHLEGSGHRATVYSDHKNLLWFTETKVLNRRQARWAEKLSRFDFVIVFRPGKDQGKPDALSRRRH